MTESLFDAIIEGSTTADCGHSVECTEICGDCNRCQGCCTCWVTQTIDRLISNHLPQAIEIIKAAGCHNLARQLRTDLGNLEYWQSQARYSILVDKKLLAGLDTTEEVELTEINGAIDASEEQYYAPIKKLLAKLLEENDA